MASACSLNLTEADVLCHLSAPYLITRIEDAFRTRFPRVTIAPRQQFPIDGGVFLSMSCFDPVELSLGIKLITVRDCPSQGEDRVHATYLLLDPTTAEPILTIAANHLTALRTAAASAAATRHLARENCITLGIFGTGRLARTHLTVLPLVRNFERVLVCGRNAEASANFAKVMSTEFHAPIVPADPRTLARESDVLCTCTTARSPLFDGRDLRPGTHLNLVGAFQPDAREADTVSMRRARIFIDTYEGAGAEAGDVLIPLKDGAIASSHVVGDLHELVSGKKPGRTSAEDITVFKSVGCALEDLVAAELLQAAKE